MRVAALLLVAAGPVAAAPCDPGVVTVQGDFGQARFAVEIADDRAEMMQGLMGVESMGTLEGMLFVYPDAGQRSFWMRNTLIPLDMIFAGPDGTVVHVHENAVPLDETPIPSPEGEPVKFVLEINGGLSSRLGIAEGDVLQHPAIGEGAALPCG